MEQSKKTAMYRNMFFVSIASGVFGVFFLSKGLKSLGGVFIGIWAVFTVIVWVLVIMDKIAKNRKEI